MAHILDTLLSRPYRIPMVFCITLLYIPLPLQAKDLGNYGYRVPVAEENLITFLQERMESLSEKEKIALFEEMKNSAINAANHPKSLHLPRAQKGRIFTYNPTIEVGQDIKGAKNEILVKKGTQFNPLKITSLDSNLCFFDASDALQLEWAKQQQGTWILTGGSPINLEEEEKVPVYFDQGGALCSKLGIKALPALVKQKDEVLIIEEFELDNPYLSSQTSANRLTISAYSSTENDILPGLKKDVKK